MPDVFLIMRTEEAGVFTDRKDAHDFIQALDDGPMTIGFNAQQSDVESKRDGHRKIEEFYRG